MLLSWGKFLIWYSKGLVSVISSSPEQSSVSYCDPWMSFVCHMLSIVRERFNAIMVSCFNVLKFSIVHVWCSDSLNIRVIALPYRVAPTATTPVLQAWLSASFAQKATTACPSHPRTRPSRPRTAPLVTTALKVYFLFTSEFFLSNPLLEEIFLL